MDFDFTDDQVSLRDAVARWVDKGFSFERRHGIDQFLAYCCGENLVGYCRHTGSRGAFRSKQNDSDGEKVAAVKHLAPM
mgnify:CR=1 FL=1